MPGHPAAELAALDALFQRRRIFIDDYRAGREFALLAERQTRAFYCPIYVAASGARRSRAAETRDRVGGAKVWSLRPATGRECFRIARQFKYRGNHQCRGREPRARRRESLAPIGIIRPDLLADLRLVPRRSANPRTG
jgi:hypothetical protein